MSEETDPDRTETALDESPASAGGDSPDSDGDASSGGTNDTGDPASGSDTEGNEFDDEAVATQETSVVAESIDEEDREDAENDLERQRRRLEEREMGLDKRAEELDEREQMLDERERALDEREQDLDEYEAELERRAERLDERNANLNQRREELDDWERDLEEYEAELADRAAELDEHEETLNRYIQGQVEDMESRVQDTMRAALDAYEQNRTPGRFGRTVNLLVGFVGLVLVAAGVGYGAWVVDDAPVLFDDATVDLGVAAVLLVVGIVTNLVTVTDRL